MTDTSPWTIDISLREDVSDIPQLAVEEFLAATLALLSEETTLPEAQELSVVFTSDQEIQQLNRDYRGKDKPTDVLSFALQEEQPSGESCPSLGDIVISVETAEKQAKEYGVTRSQELSRLLIHGLLHLLGYDHENVSEEDAQQMFDLQDKLLETVPTLP